MATLHMAELSDMNEYDTLISIIKHLALSAASLQKAFEDYAARDVRPMVLESADLLHREGAKS